MPMRRHSGGAGGVSPPPARRSDEATSLSDLIAGLADLDKWASPAMAQPPGRDPSRPFAALAAAQGLGVSDPGRRTRRSRQNEAARHSSTERPNSRLP